MTIGDDGKSLPPNVLEGLVASSNRDRDREERLHRELRGLRRFNRKLSDLVTVNGAQLVRLEAAIAGAQEPDVGDESTEGRSGLLAVVDWSLRRAHELAAEWTKREDVTMEEQS